MSPSAQGSAASIAASGTRSKASGSHIWLDRALDAHAGDPGRLPYVTPAHPGGKQQQLHRQALVVNVPPAAEHYSGKAVADTVEPW